MTVPLSSRVRVRFQSYDGGTVAHVTVGDGTKLNIINSRLMTEFIAAIADLEARDDLRAVVLTGASDKAFIGGADIREMVGLNAQTAEAFITQLHRMCNCLRELPVPVIARINGYALGAGLEVAAACDIRIAATTAIFGMPEVKVGIPSVIEAALLPNLIGWGRTRELLMFGENIGAQDAYRWGLVEQVVEPAGLDAAVDARLRGLLTAGPQAVRLQKKLMREWEELTPSQAVQAGIQCFVESWKTEEPAQMMRAFLNRRRPAAGQD